MSPAPRLVLSDLTKRYGGILALDRVGLAVAAGEVHALVGENGAGKSTLMKILSGAIRRDGGAIALDGRPVELASPADAIRAGIGMIAQELRLVPGMTVAENVALGAEPTRRTGLIDRTRMEAAARRALDELGEPQDPAAPVSELGPAARQIVAIARAIRQEVRVLALDEPTAALSAPEVTGLFGTIERLKSRGAAILYVSHRLDEVARIADRVTVLRDGRKVATEESASLDRERLIRMMVGRELRAPVFDAASLGAELLRLEDVRSASLRGVDLQVRCGEVVGVAGLAGSGRSALVRLIAGADRLVSGRILLEGRPIAPASPRQAIALGIGLLPEERDRLGLIPSMNVRENITLAALGRMCVGPFIRRTRERAAAADHAARLRIKAPSLEAGISELSGGNRQKVVLARWLATRSRLLLFDEPTAGVDVGARAEIHATIRELAAEGRAAIVVSSDLDELLAVCDRIVVLARGGVSGELRCPEATAEAILALATAAA